MKNIYFIHIPKTAGMSIENVFYKYKRYNYVSESFFKNYKHKDILNKKYQFLKISKWHIPINYLNKSFIKDIKNNYTIFTIVRNPFDRIVSVFKFWIMFQNQHKDSTNMKFINLIKEVNTIYKSFEITPENLNHFVKKVLSSHKFKFSLDGHLLPMYLYVYLKTNNKIVKITQVLKYESLNDDFNKFTTEYAPEIPKNILRRVNINKSDTKVSKNDLDKESIELIKKYYKLDFKYFGY